MAGTMPDVCAETARWDPGLTRQISNWVGPAVRRYFRAEVRGMASVPAEGGALVVSNHSGGLLAPDVMVFAPAFYDHFGFGRPLAVPARDGMLAGPPGDILRRAGVIPAGDRHVADALCSGAVVLVFPGGDYDSYRPTSTADTVAFGGRTGYVRAALEAGVPIVPVVSVGAQETQMFLARGDRLARRLGLGCVRMDVLPVSVGLPFGLSVVFPPNLPLPSKIVTRVLDPVDLADVGADADADEIDRHVRSVMQAALDELARTRRFPVLG